MSSKTVTPECSNRGSNPNSAWIPAESMRADSSLGEYGLEFLSGILRFILVHARKIMKSFRVAA